MGEVPRHLFVSPPYRRQAYRDHPLPIDEGQTISQPYIVALMTQYLGVQPGDKVLEIGTRSGYQAAVLARLTDHVFSIEIRDKLAEQAGERLKELGCDQVRVKCAEAGDQRIRVRSNGGASDRRNDGTQLDRGTSYRAGCPG